MMTNNVPCSVEFLTLIAGRKYKDALLDALSEAGGKLINIVYGKGGAKLSYIKDVLGLVPEENKVVITCLMSGEKSDAVFNMLIEKFHFDKPNTGIAFAISIGKLSY
jgi:alcohol dehydrogenase class IV